MLNKRYKYESTRMGGYELIYPSSSDELNQVYEMLINKANDIWDEFTTGKNRVGTRKM